MLMGATIASGNRQPASVAVATDVVSMSKGSNSMNYRTFTLERLDTPTGPILIVTDEERVLRAVDWEDHEPRMQRLLQRHYGNGAIRLNETARPSAARGALRAYFDGHIEALRALPTATQGTGSWRTRASSVTSRSRATREASPVGAAECRARVTATAPHGAR